MLFNWSRHFPFIIAHLQLIKRFPINDVNAGVMVSGLSSHAVDLELESLSRQFKNNIIGILRFVLDQPT